MLTFHEYKKMIFRTTGVAHTAKTLHNQYGHYVNKEKSMSDFRLQRDTLQTPTKRLTRNRCQCSTCLDIIESKSVHDFVQCQCKRIFTDGGLEYIRRGCMEANDIIDLTEFEEIAP